MEQVLANIVISGCDTHMDGKFLYMPIGNRDKVHGYIDPECLEWSPDVNDGWI